MVDKTIFFPPKSKRLAKAISIESPTEFRKSIGRVRRMKGVKPSTKVKALVLAQNRARAQLLRRNLSGREQREMRTISNITIPSIKSRKYWK